MQGLNVKIQQYWFVCYYEGHINEEAGWIWLAGLEFDM